MLTVFRGIVIRPDKLIPRGVVVVSDDRIVAVGSEADTNVPAGAVVVDGKDGYISPGFVDIHTHGGAGSDYMDGTPKAVRIANRAHAAPRHHDHLSDHHHRHAGAACCHARRRRRRRTRLEPRGRRSHRRSALVRAVFRYGQGRRTSEGVRRHPDPAEYEPALARGLIKSATCAAELPGAVAFCRAWPQVAWSPAAIPTHPGPRCRPFTTPACATSTTSGTP